MPNQYPARPTSTKEMIKARINEYNNTITESTIVAEQQQAKETRKQNAIYESIYKNREAQTSRYQKFTAFTEQVRDMLFEHAMFTLCSGALKKVDEKRHTSIMENYDNNTALHSMIYKFIHENGGSASLMGAMRRNGNTYYLESLYSIIDSTFKAILESVDKNDPDSLVVDNMITSQFKDKIASEDTDVMSDAISDRVAAAIGDFIEDNVKDKEAITAALERTKEKIDSIESDREDLKESYVRLGKKFITEVRNKKHGLFNEMVSMLTKDVIKNQSLHESYMDGAHVNIGKVVEKTTIMYSFLETVNTMRLINITPEYIKENVLKF